MSNIKSILAGALFLFLSTSSAPALVVINDDGGGLIDEYVLRYQIIRASQDRILIDGMCASACTLFLGTIDPSRVCVTDNAKLGFHSASEVNRLTRESRFSEKGTALLWLTYPQNVKDLLKSKGFDGQEHPDLVMIEGKELQSIVQPCTTRKSEEVFTRILAAIAAVKAWLLKEEQTVESILGGWYKAIQQLEAHAEQKVSEVIFHNEVATTATENAAKAEREASAAKNAASGIANVLSAPTA